MKNIKLDEATLTILRRVIERVKVLDILGTSTTDKSIKAFGAYAFERAFRDKVTDPVIIEAAMCVPIGEIDGDEERAAFMRLFEACKATKNKVALEGRWSGLYTASQLESVLGAWGVDAPPPPKGKPLLHTFNKECGYPYGRVTWTPERGTCGHRLYLVELSHTPFTQ